MAAGATGAIASAYANQQSCRYECCPLSVNLWLWHSGDERIDQRGADEPTKERQSPANVPGSGSQQSAQNAADARNAAVEQHKDGSRKADHYAARQSGYGCEGIPINGHAYPSSL